MITMHTEHGDFTGRTVDTVIRREYGRQAFRHSSGVVAKKSKYDANAVDVLAKIRKIDGEPVDSPDPDDLLLAGVEDACVDAGSAKAALDGAVERRDRLIREAIAAGVSVALIEDASGLHRQRIYQIRDSRR